MSRVPWTRYAGEDVEAVVAMMMNRERPNSVRITPSKGDGGVDILDRRGGPDQSDLVIQVKRYTEKLTSKQKKEVEKSLTRLTTDQRWAHLTVKEWRLVTPWDPTPEAEAWLQALGHKYGVEPVWDGLVTVDQLTAKYPDVIDYYLNGERSRVLDAYKAAAALFAPERVEGDLSVDEVTTKLQTALGTLNQKDPHYRYEVAFGEGQPPHPKPKPGLVMTWVEGRADDGPWRAVDVIARCAASVQERPITVDGQFTAEPGSSFAKILEDFHRYGTPFTSPPGAYSGSIDAPGGLGGPLVDGIVKLAPVDDDIGEYPDLKLEVLDPAGEVIGAVDVERVDITHGTEGDRVVLRERNSLFTIETRRNRATGAGTRKFIIGAFVGEPVKAVHAALSFLMHTRKPNVWRISRQHTPPELGHIDTSVAVDWPENEAGRIAKIVGILDDLAEIQSNTTVPLVVPDLVMTPAAQLAEWRATAKILRGEEVAVTYPEGHALIFVLDVQIAAPLPDPLVVEMPLVVSINDQRVELGRVLATVVGGTLTWHRENGDLHHHAITSPDRRVTYQRAP